MTEKQNLHSLMMGIEQMNDSYEAVVAIVPGEIRYF